MACIILTPTLHRWGRSEGRPQWLGTGLTTSWHVEADRYEFMTLHDYGGHLVPISNLPQDWWSSILIWLSRLSLTSVQNLQICVLTDLLIYHIN